MKKTFLGGSVLMFLAAPVFAQDVWVVDDVAGPGVDFTEIQAAVLAAGDGDVIVVGGGTYGSFAIEGKSLVVTADLGAAVVIREVVPFGSTPPATQVRVFNLDPDDDVVLRGLIISPDPNVGSFLGSLSLEDNSGDVLIEDCQVTGNSLLFGPLVIGGTPALPHGHASLPL